MRVRSGSSSTSPMLEEYTYDTDGQRIRIHKNNTANTTIYTPFPEFMQIKNLTGTYDFTYIYDGDTQVARKNPDGTIEYDHTDHLGSVGVVTNSSGGVVENTLYSPHGEILSGGSVSRFDSEGKEFDSVVGDTDFHFRKMNPSWGLFLQPDTLISNQYDPQMLNRYMFERGNAQKYTDPDGHVLWVPFAIGAAAGLIHASYHLYKNPGDYRGAALHGTVTAVATTTSLLAPVGFVASGAVRVVAGVGSRLFAIGATESLYHTAIDGGGLNSQTLTQSVANGVVNIFSFYDLYKV